MAQNEHPQTEDNTVLNIIIGIAVLVAIGFLAFFVIQSQQGASNTDASAVPEVSAADHVKGAEDAEHTVIEYGDFQCPACKQYSPILGRLVEENDNVRLVYRHLPLSVHDKAEIAAQASEAAAKQDAFWAYHDKLFENQNEWSEEGDPKQTFISYAEELELDTGQFEQDMTSSEVQNTVSEDARTAQQAGLTSTPSLVVNGEILDQLPRTYAELEERVLGQDTEDQEEDTTEQENSGTEEDAPTNENESENEEQPSDEESSSDNENSDDTSGEQEGNEGEDTNEETSS